MLDPPPPRTPQVVVVNARVHGAFTGRYECLSSSYPRVCSGMVASIRVVYVYCFGICAAIRSESKVYCIVWAPPCTHPPLRKAFMKGIVYLRIMDPFHGLWKACHRNHGNLVYSFHGLYRMHGRRLFIIAESWNLSISCGRRIISHKTWNVSCSMGRTV